MKPNALVFFDLDGTLLDRHSKITAEIASAMAELQKNNILPVIATGRTNPEIKEIAKASGINGLITMNGQYVQIAGKEVYSEIIPEDVAKRFLEAADAKGDEVGFYNHTKIRVTGHSDLLVKCYNFIHSPVPPIDRDFYQKEPLNMLLSLSTKGDEYYHSRFPELKFFRNGPYSIDIISAGGSKGHGIKKLVENMGYEGVPTYGFGDGPNDIDLLSACDHKIAMGNAKPELLAIADFVTHKNTEDGIVFALKHFGLLE